MICSSCRYFKNWWSLVLQRTSYFFILISYIVDTYFFHFLFIWFVHIMEHCVIESVGENKGRDSIEEIFSVLWKQSTYAASTSRVRNYSKLFSGIGFDESVPNILAMAVHSSWAVNLPSLRISIHVRIHHYHTHTVFLCIFEHWEHRPHIQAIIHAGAPGPNAGANGACALDED